MLLYLFYYIEYYLNMTIWLASGNMHKKREMEALFKGEEIRIPLDAGIPFDPDERGETFMDNALIKARELYGLVKEPVIADDSGLCVDVLGGRPGVHSARYGGEDGRKLLDSQRNELLLSEVGDAHSRKARFVCALALVLSPDRFFAVQETLEGELARHARGTGGFGYDPILYLPERGKTVAELTEEEKNACSHRAKAARHMAKLLAGLFSL